MNNLTPLEEKQLQSLLNNQRRDIRSLNITSNLFLVFGGLLLIGTAFYLLKNPTDSAAYFVGLPNFVGGMLLILAYVLLSRRVIQLKQLNSLLLKLSEMKVAA
jgi:hypothetical protein